MPRERLNQTVIHDPQFKGVVLFLSPLFVNDVNRSKYKWSVSLMDDFNAVVSTKGEKIEYDGPDSLKWKKFAGVLGHKYANLENRFGGDIRRSDSVNEQANLLKVMAGRADVTIMANSIFRYVSKQAGAEYQIYVSSKPHASFSRHIFAANGEKDLIEAIDGILAGSKKDPVWKAILLKYNLE